MAWTPKVTVGTNDLIYSGSVVLNVQHNIRITPVPGVPIPYYVEIVFEDDVDDPGLTVTNTDDNGVVVTLRKFGVNAASSTTQPVRIGLLRGEPLLLALASYPIGGGNNLVRMLLYSFYGKE